MKLTSRTESAGAAPHDFDAWYAQHATATLAVVIALRGAGVGAEDIVQEAFLRALQRWRQVGVMDRPDLWVQRVALNLATSRLRRMGAERRAVDRLGRRDLGRPDAGGVPDQTPQSSAFQREQDFWAFVRRLPDKQRRVVALRYAGDLSIREIAEVVGSAEGTVKAQLHTARRRLKTLLTQTAASTQTVAPTAAPSGPSKPLAAPKEERS